MKIKANIDIDGPVEKPETRFVVYLYCLPNVGDFFEFKNIDVADWIKEKLWKVYHVGHKIDVNSHEIEIFLKPDNTEI